MNHTEHEYDALRRLTDIEEIKRLKARYFRLVDTKDWQGWREVFTPDAHVEIDSVVRTPTALVRDTREWLANATTTHVGHMPEIDIQSPDTATGIWGMADYIVFPETGGARQGLRGSGHYHERYRKIDGSWLIHYLRLDRLRIDLLDGGLPPAA
ncbi:nuclear transport factor 2 family protein [Streptomyces sp. NPDC051217]|uniref:nuclear transport factor 2 family protein n=1 Tax=Streptomyces sp. NPDC051217 TaxID=3365644 RepID=UPI0037A9059F